MILFRLLVYAYHRCLRPEFLSSRNKNVRVYDINIVAKMKLMRIVAYTSFYNICRKVHVCNLYDLHFLLVLELYRRVYYCGSLSRTLSYVETDFITSTFTLCYDVYRVMLNVFLRFTMFFRVI